MGIDAALAAEANISKSEAKQLCQDYTEAIGRNRHYVFWEKEDEDPEFNPGPPEGLELVSSQKYKQLFHVVQKNIKGSVFFRENANAHRRLYWPGYERGPWGDIALSVGWLYNRLPQMDIFYIPDHGQAYYPLPQTSMAKVTRHWAIWGREPYKQRKQPDEVVDWYDLNDATYAYPWYSVAYHICKRAGRGSVMDWDLMPEPDPLTDHEEVVQEILSESIVEEHRQSIARAMGN